MIVGEAIYPDSLLTQQQPRGSVYGANVNSATPGESFEDTLNGQTQIFRTAAAAALLISATSGNVPTLWNPSNSNRIFIPKKVILGYVSGTTVIGGVVFAKTATQAGTAVIATNGPIITFTAVAGSNSGLGAPKTVTTGMLWAPAVCTFVAAPTVFMDSAINMGAVAPTNGGNSFVHKFDGELIIWPGQAFSVCYSVTTSTALFNVTLIGIEKNLPQMRPA